MPAEPTALPPAPSALRRALRRARDGVTLDATEATVLLHARGLEPGGDLADLCASAARVRDAGLAAAGRPGVVTYSRKVFVPLTRLCRDRCHYCTFATDPASLRAGGHGLYLSPDEVLDDRPARGRRWAARRCCSPSGTGPRTAGRRPGSGSTRTATTTRCPTSGRWPCGCWRRPGCCRTSTPA